MSIERRLFLSTMGCLALFAAALVPGQARAAETPFADEWLENLIGTWDNAWAVTQGEPDFFEVKVEWSDAKKNGMKITFTQAAPDPSDGNEQTLSGNLTFAGPWTVSTERGHTRKRCKGTLEADGESIDVTVDYPQDDYHGGRQISLKATPTEPKYIFNISTEKRDKDRGFVSWALNGRTFSFFTKSGMKRE